jgi:hypothetical protein
LYRNDLVVNADGTRTLHFTDVTEQSGINVQSYGMGVAVGDYNNDGFPDIFITCVGQNRLFRNTGKGTFVDVTQKSGLGGKQALSTSALWFDYDRDGLLDLFVCNYVRWSPEHDVFCSLDGKHKSYCTPEAYRGETCWLFHNRGNGTFEDVTARSGIFDSSSKALGVAMLDFDRDGWPDLLVANDTQPNKLYRNLRNGTFEDVAVRAGVAFSEDGKARAGMGVDAADYDRSGHTSLIITNFSNQMLSLYHNEGNGLFVDEAPSSAVGRASLLSLAFGVFFFDYDLDGHPDIFAGNGHIEEEIGKVQPKVSYREAPLLFHNLGNHKFENVSGRMGAAFNRAIVARGAAYADFDRDGDLDLLISTNHGPAYLFRNDGGNRNHWLSVRLAGTKSNRDGIGAVVCIESASGKQWSMVRSGSSYCSQSDLALTFGLGKDAAATVQVEWPSGAKQQVGSVAADQFVTIDEGRGITARAGERVSLKR